MGRTSGWRSSPFSMGREDRIWRHTLCIMLLLGRPIWLSASQAELVEPWDPIYVEMGKRVEVSRAKKRPPVILAEWLIGFYQSKLSTRSISRCPFHTSCSVFAREAIRRKGILLGTSMFIDRFYFREHSHNARYYGLRTRTSGKLKLDDHFFLYNQDQFTESMR